MMNISAKEAKVLLELVNAQIKSINSPGSDYRMRDYLCEYEMIKAKLEVIVKYG